MGDPPPFAVLNVDSNAQAYKNFIMELRRRLADPRHSSHNRPVLPPQENPPRTWVDIVLQTGDGEQRRRLRIRIRRDNLYVDGFRDEDDGPWYEFNRRGDSSHLIPDSICE